MRDVFDSTIESAQLENAELTRAAEEHRKIIKQYLLRHHSLTPGLRATHENPSDEYLLSIHFDPQSQQDAYKSQVALRECLEKLSAKNS